MTTMTTARPNADLQNTIKTNKIIQDTFINRMMSTKARGA